MKLLFGSDYITCKLIVICIKYTLDQDLLDLLCQTNPSKSVIVNLKLWRDEFLPFTRTIEPVWRSFFWVPKKGDPLFSFLSANCNKRFLALVVTCALPVQWSLPFISVVFFHSLNQLVLVGTYALLVWWSLPFISLVFSYIGNIPVKDFTGRI